jgi:hypothetical protein
MQLIPKKLLHKKFGPFQWVPRTISDTIIGELNYNNWGALKIIFKMFEMLVCSKIRKSVLGYGTLVRNRIGV